MIEPKTKGAEPETEKRCGNCRLWGMNFYSVHHRNNTCCADAVMDLPASFIPNRQTMNAEDGKGCCAWQAMPDD